MRGPNTPLAKLLVAYYGLIQTVHLVVLARAATLLLVNGSITFPAPPPPGGWTTQASHFLVGLGGVDAANAMAALAFVYGFFSRARWRYWLGTLTLSVAGCSALLFAYGTIASGAWAHNPVSYLSITLAFAPVAALTILFGTWISS